MSVGDAPQGFSGCAVGAMIQINQRGPKRVMQPVQQQLAIVAEIRTGVATGSRCADEETWPGHQYL
jgi:hypothetical protein